MTFSKRLLIVILGGIFLIHMYVIYHNATSTTHGYYSEGFQSHNGQFLKKFPEDYTLEDPNPLILFWTGFFGSASGWLNFYGTPSADCSQKCRFSFNKNDLENSTVVVMNVRDLYDFNRTLPPERRSSQIWLLHNTESPEMSFLDLSSYGGIFNLTSFVRLDSDVPAFYGKAIPRTAESVGGVSFRLKNLSEPPDHRPTQSVGSPTVNGLVDLAASPDPKPVAWMVSNCASSNNREWYVRQLRRHIGVAVFGKCGPSRKCPRASEDCDALLQRHSFYLAFENADCRDYVSEKFWRALGLGLIPVVMGGKGSHEKVAPPGSYIDVHHFSGPENLASYLLKVATNASLRQSYFDWKSNWTVGGNYFCDLCAAVHNFRGRKHQVYEDLLGWFRQDTCKPYDMWLGMQLKIKIILYYTLYYLGLW